MSVPIWSLQILSCASDLNQKQTQRKFRDAFLPSFLPISLLSFHSHSPLHHISMEAPWKEEDQGEPSMFETSHVLGAHLVAATPLLPQSWRQCALASAAAGGAGFVAEQVGSVLYVSFSAARPLAASVAAGGGFFSAVPIDSGGGGKLFSALVGWQDDEEAVAEPVLVHACAFELFLAIHSTPEFQMLITETGNKTVIFTGHSIGGSIASLAALYFLCLSSRSTDPSPASLLCITFGSPLLGNEAFCQAILREGWGGRFCHVVTQHDIMPRLLFCPQNSISPQLIAHLLQSWQFSLSCPKLARPASKLLSGGELHQFISVHINSEVSSPKSTVLSHERSPFRPFGFFVMCSTQGAVCIGCPLVVVQMLYLTFVTGSVSSSIEDEHLSYGELVVTISHNLLLKKKIAIEGEIPRSNYSAGVSLALEASGIGIQDMGAVEARECLKMSKRRGESPILNCANLIKRLSKVTPCRAQIERYKQLCDNDTGYYDAFKNRKASIRDSKVNMNRIKLGKFWDDVIEMIRNNQLPHDFHKRRKWVNAAHFYKLLVEPLDIADYYRSQMHKKKGHYLAHGRERRYELFDRWWSDQNKDSLERVNWKRSRFAGQTQDSCFWARVEEAREWMDDAKNEIEPKKLALLWENLNRFECYAKKLVEMKEVSIDVVAPRSSYTLWMEEWKDLKLKLGLQMSPLFQKVLPFELKG